MSLLGPFVTGECDKTPRTIGPRRFLKITFPGGLTAEVLGMAGHRAKIKTRYSRSVIKVFININSTFQSFAYFKYITS